MLSLIVYEPAAVGVNVVEGAVPVVKMPVIGDPPAIVADHWRVDPVSEQSSE